MAAVVSTSLPVSRIARCRQIDGRGEPDRGWGVRPPRRPHQTQWKVTRTIADPARELAG